MSASTRLPWVFFYGSFINRAVLAGAGFVPDSVELARLDGFDIVIRPLANIVPAPGRSVFGILTRATHAELERLYAHARDDLGGTYLPEAVLVAAGERLVPALCYIAPELPDRPAAPEYVQRIVGPAKELGMPEWYVDRLESFTGGRRSTPEQPPP